MRAPVSKNFRTCFSGQSYHFSIVSHIDDPDNSSWQQKKHKFNDLPAHVKGYVRDQLKVPTIHSETILSNPQMSVLDDEDAGGAFDLNEWE